MKVFRAAVVIALLAGPSYAQDANGIMPRYGDINKPDKTPQEKEADRAAERAYKNSLGNIPDKGGSSDPWGTVRVEPPKPAPKAAVKSSAVKPQTKTGATAN
jgi:hypothetical protein